jgi:nitronate monooxygenase
MSLQTLFGIEIPLIQAPMAGFQASAMTIAVSNAGGLGSLPCASFGLAALRAEVAAIRSATTRPFNLNFFCHTPPQPDARREAAWRELLAPYYREYGLAIKAPDGATGRQPFSEEVADALDEFRPPVVSFHFGLPPPVLMERVHRWGSKILSSATTVEEALWLEANGADAVIAQGLEAGGHRGFFLTQDLSSQSGTFALLPQIVAAVRIPVIASGGLADARGIAAAIALGASGVQLGTAYLLCPESTATPMHRAAIKSRFAQHTALTNLVSGGPARGIRNRLMNELGPLNESIPAFPLAAAALAPLRAAAENSGSGDFSALWCGQNASGCREIPARQLTLELAKGLPRATHTP